MAPSQFPRVSSQCRKSAGFQPSLERLEGREVPAGISVVYNTTQDWGSGFQGSFVIRNETASPVNDWKLEFDWGASISSIWDATVASRSGSRYLVANAGWNGVIAAGGTVSFGLLAAPGAVAGAKPANYALNGVPLGSTAPLSPSISVADAKVTEGNAGTSMLVFPVALSSISATPVTVAYSTASLTATAGSDFTQASGTITFAPGETSKTVSVAVSGDTMVEQDETLSIKLSGPTGATLGAATATGTIINDDVAAGTGEIRFQVTSDWGTGYNGQVTITNQRPAALTGWNLSFDYDGTISSIWDAKIVSRVGNRWTVASAGWNDSIPVNGSVSFGYGGVAGSTYPRPTNFLLAAGSVPAPAPAPQPTVSIAAASVAEGNSGTRSLSFAVSLSAASASPVTVTLNTADGTAKAGADYQALSASVITIAAGAVSATVSVPVIGDTSVEPDETLSVTISAAAGAVIGTASATGTIINDDTAQTPPPSSNPVPGAGKKRVVGYFAEWGIYGRNYTIADLPVDKLTTINYAFAKITDSGEVGIFDSWAAVEKPFGSDTWSTPLRGNFHQLQLLKAARPNLEIMISIGGWTLSDKFSDVALTEASRARFAASCLAFCKQYGFDGVDLDWEYPVSGGLSSNTYRPEDKRNYTLLVEEIRRQFNAADALDGKHRLISIAAPAGYDKIVNLEPAALARSLDFMNLMTYDYHGSWENTTNHQAALYANPADPSGEGARYTIAYTVDAYLAAGVPAEKMVLGAPIYGRSWRGVGPANNGLFQPATGAGSGTWENGSVDYADLLNKVKTQPSVYKLNWDASAGVPYVYAPTVEGGWFSTFENTQSLNLKIDYLMSKGLGGVMFWEASGDVRDSNSPDSLIGAAAKRLL